MRTLWSGREGRKSLNEVIKVNLLLSLLLERLGEKIIRVKVHVHSRDVIIKVRGFVCHAGGSRHTAREDDAERHTVNALCPRMIRNEHRRGDRERAR